MNKKKILIGTISVVLIVGVIATLFIWKNGTDENKKEYSIDENLYKQLVEESNNDELNTKVADYIKNGGKYFEKDKVQVEDVVYKCVQLNLYDEWDIQYNDAFNILLSDDELRKIILEEETNQITESPAMSNKYKKVISSRVLLGMNEDLGKVVTFEKGSNFDMFDEWVVTGIVKCDMSGKILDIVAFDGAVGNVLEIEDDKLCWEVCIAEKIDLYYWGANVFEDDKVDGTCRMSGSVYNMVLNDECDIEDISYVRESKNNDLDSLFCKYTNCLPYVKNYDLKLEDFINNEEFKALLSRNSSDFDQEICRMFGKEHETGTYEQDCMYYFTSDGYLVCIKKVPTWTKITMEEAYKIDVDEWADMADKTMFVGKVNKELAKNIQITEGIEWPEDNISVADALLTKEEKEEVSAYLESIGYFTYDKYVQYALEHNGKKYIALQVNTWFDGVDKSIYNLYDFTKYSEKFEEVTLNFSEDNIFSKTEYSEYRDYMETNIFEKQKDNIGELIVYDNSKYDYISKGWLETILLIIDDGKIEKEAKREGTITTGLEVKDGCVEWEIYISKKVEYYAVQLEGTEKELGGYGYDTGEVYRLVLDERGIVDKKEMVRESVDNDYESLSIKEDYTDYYSELRDIYVKNNHLAMNEILGNARLEDIVSKGQAVEKGMALLGAPHQYRGVYDGPSLYFTTDGYVILLCEYPKYMKMSKEEFLEKYPPNKDRNWENTFVELMYEIVVNPELLEE